MKQREAIRVWLPAFDHLVRLVLETVEDGWPFQRYPDDWSARAQVALSALPPTRRFAPWIAAVSQVPKLTGKEVGRIRSLLAGVQRKRGLPDSPKCQELRAEQLRRLEAETGRSRRRSESKQGALLPGAAQERRANAAHQRRAIRSPVTLAWSGEQDLTQLVRTSITTWPYRIFPNALVQRFKQLSPLPFVENLPAVTFRGTFSREYVDAAILACQLMQGTLYARYFAIDCSEVKDESSFLSVCRRRAVKGGEVQVVVKNGTLLEQEQILTTHNLATLVRREDPYDWLYLSRACFDYALRTQRMWISHFQGRLRSVRNAGYAWRQMLFFLSFVSMESQREFVLWANQRLARHEPDFARRFQPALAGLRAAVNGDRPDQIFLGWSLQRHWLLPPKTRAHHGS